MDQSSDPPHLAVVILNYNGAELLETFLPLVIQHSKGHSVVVADNCSQDHSRQLLREQFPEVHLIELDQNWGFSGGYNKALSALKADYYVLLNSDVEVTP
ncbi:MAG: glycosyltransferase, partial [Bacteroidota bacterium]